jgi:hypothetical protein
MRHGRFSDEQLVKNPWEAGALAKLAAKRDLEIEVMKHITTKMVNGRDASLTGRLCLGPRDIAATGLRAAVGGPLGTRFRKPP